MRNKDELLRRVAQAIANNKPATKEDLLENKELAFTLTPDFMGYSNPRTTAVLDSLSASEVVYLKFIPMVQDGVVAVLAADKNETGATEFIRADSRRTGVVSLRPTLVGFNLQFSEDRKLLLPIEAEDVPGPDGVMRRVVLIRVKQPTTKKRQTRQSADDTENAAEGKTNAKTKRAAKQQAKQKAKKQAQAEATPAAQPAPQSGAAASAPPATQAGTQPAADNKTAS